MFLVGYGFEKRESRIMELLDDEPTTAVILASVHFEWSLKRAILMLGQSPTALLRKKLERVWFLGPDDKDHKGNQTVKGIWNQEISSQYKNGKIGKVIANFPKCIEDAKAARGRVIHGNGTVSRKSAEDAVTKYLKASRKIYLFARKHNLNLDSRLKARLAQK